MKVAMLTGGGDCPGLNAVMRAAVRQGTNRYGDELFGFRDAWKGVMEGEAMPLTIDTFRGLLPRGGTVLGSSRVDPFSVEGGVEAARATLERLGIEALVVIGGEGSLGIAKDMDAIGVPVVGVPKTIDNDISGTDRTFGFDTAVAIATEAVDRLHTTAESHNRIMVVEVMGRHAGHIAVWSAIAGGATYALIPEVPFDIDRVAADLQRRHEGGRWASIVVVAEGAVPAEGSGMTVAHDEVDEFGHVRLGGIGHRVAEELEARTGYDTRVTVLGHVQRGGTPTAFDRVLATRFGVAAIDAVHDEDWGKMVALVDGEIERVPLSVAVGTLKVVDPALYDVAKVFFAG